jgi:filamentous hemagglutinin family protein
MKASSNRLSLLLIALSLQSVNLSTAYAQTRTITPAPDGTGTVINRQGNRFDINGGSVSRDGQNLFHSFEQFNLSEGQIANFLSHPNIRNILGRVVGGDASFINGLIEVTGGNSNLFLMNPAGIIFGANASLNIPASFTATTANGIGFGANTWFDVSSNSDWSNLVGTPNSFRFDTQNPGSIINLGELAVSSEQQLTLVAGTIINTGTLAAPEGTVSVQTVPGENVVRIVQTGHLLNLEVAALPANSVSNQPSITPLSLPELLTGGDATTATGIIVNSNGEIVLTSGQIVESGDIAVTPQQNLEPNNLAVAGETVTLNAANNFTLAERSLETTGDLNLIAENTVKIRDSLTHPFSAIAGGNITVIGLQNIDILALDSINILGSAPFQAAGNLTLVSDGIISGDSHFNAGGNFNILNSIGTGGTFISLYDPIIYSDGDVVFGSYEGASLKVEATGAIIGGDINITTADINLANSADPEANILSSSPALILRSGVQNLGNSANINSNTSVEGTFFLQRPASGNNNLTVGNITTAGGPVILNSTGRIVVDQINSQGGEVNLQAIDNIIIARNINSSGGNIEIITDDLLRVGTLIDPNDNTPSISSANGQIDGSITIEHGGGETPFIIGDATTNGTARSITSRLAQITPQFEVPRTTDGIFRQGNITIRTTPFPSEEPPTEPPPVEPPPVEPEEPITENPPPVEPPEEPSLPTNPGNNPPIDVPREENPNNPNNPGNETPEVPNNPGNPPVVNPPNNNPPPELPSTPETRILTPEQQESVTTVIESELVERKNSFSSPVEQLQNGSISLRNSGLDVSQLEDNSSATTVQQNADGTIALLRYNSVITEPNTASEFNPQEAIQLARAELTESLDSNNIEQAVSQIDQVYSWEYLNYLGKNIEDVEGQVSLREIQDKLSEMDKKYGTKAAMIYVLAQSNELILMAITAKGDAIQKTIENVNRQELIEVSSQFRLEITDARKRYTSSYKPLSQQLYQWLVSPLEEAIDSQKIDTLLFIMDRGLRSLPLAALHDGEQFLIEKYNFSLIPSFSLMDIRDNPLNEPRVLAMGASKFTEQPPLPAVPLEVRSITQELGGEYFINEEFTINNFRTQRINHPYNIIHLATHSEFNPGDSKNSYIQFWDQKLTLNNLKQLGWKWDNPPAELLVLSACRTAIGDESAELGFAGLAVQAGVPSALASLWYVSDQGTLGLMIEFYNQLRNKPILSQAFRDAQIAMLRGEITIESGYLLSSTFIGEIQLPTELISQGNTVFTHPYYWAGFTLIGSPW